jgi:hypothetical protein
LQACIYIRRSKKGKGGNNECKRMNDKQLNIQREREGGADSSEGREGSRK